MPLLLLWGLVLKESLGIKREWYVCMYIYLG
jgi:hypothetical protein